MSHLDTILEIYEWLEMVYGQFVLPFFDAIVQNITAELSVAVVGLSATLLMVLRRNRRTKLKAGGAPNEMEFPVRRRRLGENPKVFNPLRGVTFADMVRQVELAEKINSNAVTWLEQAIGPDEFRKMTKDAKGPELKSKITDKASQKSRSSGGSSVTVSSRQLLSTAIQVVPSVVAQASPVVPVVIGCVHFFSSFDRVGPFSKLEDKLEKWTELRALDQLSKLQSLFEELKGELDATTPDKTHLKLIRLHLRELRVALSNETRASFEAMQPPMPPGFLWYRWGRRKRRSELRDRVFAELVRLREVYIAIQLEQVTWIALSQSPTFINEIAPDIVVQLKEIADLAHTRMNWLRGSYAKEFTELKTWPEEMARSLELNLESPSLFRVPPPSRKAKNS